MEIVDGREAQILVEHVRNVRSLMGQPPHGSGMRVIILAEAQNMDPPAANVLLKSMEEPGPGNVFVLLAPQRGMLLPTLVSRSFVLTLPWVQGSQGSEEIMEWEEALIRFVTTGQGWFSRTGKKNSVDANLAKRLLLRCRKGLVLFARGEEGTPLCAWLKTAAKAPSFDRLETVLAHGLAALDKRVNPTLVLDWVAVRFWMAVHSGG
jgi:DNA polymerase-3 subunit delta'